MFAVSLRLYCFLFQNSYITPTQQKCCVMIPDLDERGNLPAGIHRASSWDTIHRRFGTNSHRIEMLDGLRIALHSLKQAGCKKVYLGGSFVTNKQHPNDYDCCWDANGVDENRLDKIFLDFSPSGRQRQKFIFKGEFVLSSIIEGATNTPFLDFFQTDRETLGRKGIVELNLEELL